MGRKWDSRDREPSVRTARPGERGFSAAVLSLVLLGIQPVSAQTETGSPAQAGTWTVSLPGAGTMSLTVSDVGRFDEMLVVPPSQGSAGQGQGTSDKGGEIDSGAGQGTGRGDDSPRNSGDNAVKRSGSMWRWGLRFLGRSRSGSSSRTGDESWHTWLRRWHDRRSGHRHRCCSGSTAGTVPAGPAARQRS